jgi:hypothetical protein
MAAILDAVGCVVDDEPKRVAEQRGVGVAQLA